MEYDLMPLTDITEITDEFVDQFNTLEAQLSRNPIDSHHEDLLDVQKRHESELMMCACNKEGMLVGVVHASYLATPPKHKLYINSVVVNESERGQGLGKSLMEATLRQAKEQWPKIKMIMLTNRPNRNNADFYIKLGFSARDKASGDETVMYVKPL